MKTTKSGLWLGLKEMLSTAVARSEAFPLLAFLIPLVVRAIPEILMGPFVVGFDTLAYYVPNTLVWLNDGVGFWNFLAVAQGYFDLIFAHEVIEHVPNDVELVLEVRNALKLGGLFILSTPNGLVKTDPKKDNPDHLRHYTPTLLIRLLESHGFQVKEILFREHFFYRTIERTLLWGSWRLFVQKKLPSGVLIKRERQQRASRIIKSLYEKFLNPIISAIVAFEFLLKKSRENGADIILIASTTNSATN